MQLLIIYYFDNKNYSTHAGDHLYSVRLLHTSISDNKAEAVLYSCLSHPVYIEVITMALCQMYVRSAVYVAVTGRKRATVSGLIRLVIISRSFTDFLCPFMNDC